MAVAGVVALALVPIALLWPRGPRYVRLRCTPRQVQCDLLFEESVQNQFTVRAAEVTRIEPIVLPRPTPRWGLEVATGENVYAAEIPFHDVRHALYFAERMAGLPGSRAR